MQNKNQSVPKQIPQPNNKRGWYKTWWGILLIIFVCIPVGLTAFTVALAIASYDSKSSDFTQANEQQTAQETASQQAEDEAAAKELTKTLIEGYVSVYCESHKQKRIPMPYQEGDNWKYNIQNPTLGVTEEDCRNIITYLVNNIESSATNLEKISRGTISVGMNKHELLMSWGVPTDVNSTHTAGGSRDQYVYGANYVYLDNDVITAIQD